MGNSNKKSAKKQIDLAQQLQEQQMKEENKKDINTIKDLKLSASDFVQSKEGQITVDYVILNPPIGKGAYGEVRKCTHKATKLTRAVKIINKQNVPIDELEKIKNEIEILRHLDHPNILKVFECYQDSRYFYIVSELCTGGELFDQIIEQKSFSEKQAASTMKQVLSAISFCHQNKIVHRDMKPENILLENNKPNALIKVVDFGTSITFDPKQKLKQKLGTPYYIAPEVLEKNYDEKCDIWSCGVILYIVLCGYPPFNGPNDQMIMDRVKIGTFNFNGEEWKDISIEAKDLIKNMLEKDTKKRYSALQCLQHQWFKTQQDKNEVDLPKLAKGLKNMQSFRAESKLQEATWMFFVNHLASQEEKEELLTAFQSLDTNGDGKLSRQELIEGYKKIMNAAQAEEEVDKILKSVDKNDSGSIDYAEWVMATVNRESLLSQQRLDMAFKYFDKDGSGTLSLQEIKEMFHTAGKVGENVWKEMIKEVDQNGDGMIQFEEFKAMMLKLTQSNKIQTIDLN